MLHHQRNENREDGDEGKEHHDGAWFFKVVAAEQTKIDGEEKHHHCYEDDLSDGGAGQFAFSGVAPFHLALERLEHAPRVFIDDVASVNDFLPREHHAAGNGNARELLVELRFAAFLVIDEVRFDVFVEVAFLQGLSLGREVFVLEQLLVGRKRGVETAHVLAPRLFSADQTHHVCRVFRQCIELGHVHDARLIELLQPFENQILICRRESGESVLKIFQKFLFHLLLYLGVDVVIGLELLLD